MFTVKNGQKQSSQTGERNPKGEKGDKAVDGRKLASFRADAQKSSQSVSHDDDNVGGLDIPVKGKQLAKNFLYISSLWCLYSSGH